MQPECSHAEREAALTTALLDSTQPIPGGLLAPNGGPVGRRFAVHRATSMLGLIAALATRHPVLEHLLGPETFATLARAFIRINRPRTALLLEWGDELPDFVAAHPDLVDWPWLADVARLEVAWNASYHAAEATPLTLAELAAIPPQQLAAARLSLHPSLRLVSAAWAVTTLWAANGQGSGVEERRESILVLRPEADVLVRAIAPGSFAFVAALAAGATVTDAAIAGQAREADFDMGASLVGLAQLGAVVGVDPEEAR